MVIWDSQTEIPFNDNGRSRCASALHSKAQLDIVRAASKHFGKTHQYTWSEVVNALSANEIAPRLNQSSLSQPRPFAGGFEKPLSSWPTMEKVIAGDLSIITIFDAAGRHTISSSGALLCGR